ncbi:MAG: antibiotic biosynthesis monooxygenase family protein [Desulfuromonadaceae bacterium]|nr:antibiotic biosynthesis monooxygenase [Desulfuromonas sp.]MDY0184622.1 antibiotic biosynthesis monooxygenase family protein [Desulfuromonadaceae bacterium]
MFIVVIAFPAIKAGRDADFRKWFASSGETFSGYPGFINRRLLQPVDGGNYAAIVEFKDQAAFKAMHGSAAHDEAGAQVMPLFEGKPTPTFYQVVGG